MTMDPSTIVFYGKFFICALLALCLIPGRD